MNKKIAEFKHQIKNSADFFLFKMLRENWVIFRKYFRNSDFDVYITGYLKVGGTWLQYMTRNLLLELTRDYNTKFLTIFNARGRIPPNIPAINILHNMPLFETDTFKNLIIDLSLYQKKKVVLQIRDPKDTLVSLYMHNKYHFEKPLYKKSIQEMVRDPIYGIMKFVRYYQLMYKNMKSFKDCLIIRYEDMKKNPTKVFTEAVKFMNINAPSELIDKVVEMGKFSNMKKLEQNKKSGWSQLENKNGTNNSMRVRKGKVGGYKEHLDKKTIIYIDNIVKEKLPKIYGY